MWAPERRTHHKSTEVTRRATKRTVIECLPCGSWCDLRAFVVRCLLYLQQHPLWVLDALLDPHQELRRLSAVDQPVIITECQVHHRADHDRVVDHDGPLLDGVHAEDRALRRVEDGRTQHRPEDATVG